jgi:hypothetical protein
MSESRLPFLVNHRLHRIILPILVAITVPTLSVSLMLRPAFAATRTWDGGGTDGACGGAAGDGNKWSCAANWSADTVPVSGDAVVFDATSTKDSTIDASFAGTITSIGINSGYTGTITMARSLTMSSSFTQAAGTFAQDAQTLTIGGNFAHTAGTFNANTGTVTLTGATPTLSGTTTFNNLYVATTTNLDVTLTLPASITTTVLGATRLLASVHSDPAINILTIVSSASGVQASVDFQGTLAIFSAHVKDTNNINATQIHCYVECVDDGNNINLRFGEPGFVRTPVSGNVTEAGTTATFTVALRGKPTASVTIPVSSSDISEMTVSPSLLVFTTSNFATPQTVTITGVDDAADDGGISSTVLLAAATSSDSLYSGLDSVDLAVYTEDNDQSATVIDFDSAALLTEEDVRGTVAWFDQTHQGEGLLKTGSGGSVVSLTGTKILPGCRATIGGNDYTISRISPSVTGQVLLSDGITRPENLYLTLVDAAVTRIVCTTRPVDSAQLGGSLSNIAVRSTLLAGTGYTEGDIFADNDNQRLWLTQTNSAPALIGISMATGLQTSSVALTGEDTDALIAYDPIRDRIWVSEYGNNQVVAVDGVTGNYAFGTIGASSFAIPGRPWEIAYNPDLDEIWLLTYGGKEVKRINPADGAVVGTVSLSLTPNRIVYDSTQHAMWVEADNAYSSVLIKLSATTGAFVNGTESASSFPIPDISSTGYGRLIYDAARNVLWATTFREADNVDRLNKIDAATGAVVGSYETGAFTFGATLDSGSGNISVAYSNYVLAPAEGSSAGIIVINGDTGERIATYSSSVGQDQGIAYGASNTLWVLDVIEAELSQTVLGAAPTNKFYTTLTTTDSNIDVSGSAPLDAVSVTESLDGGNAFYGVSFDNRQSFKVHGPWRTIASSLASDHGGTEGNWYYRDDANLWTAAPGNTVAQAISLAVENGPGHNRMTGTYMSAISHNSWSEAGGFTSSTDTIDLAVILETASPASHPAVDSVAFTFASVPSSGGSSGSGTPGGAPPVIVPVPVLPEPTPAPTPVPELISFPEGTGLMPGDFVRNENSSTVYYITTEGTKRSFVNAKTFFTYTSDFSIVKFVSDSSVDVFSDGESMPPKPGTVLVKTPSSDKVYAFASDATIEHPEIRWIPTEALAQNFFGPNWADYVIDLDQASLDLLSIGEPLSSADTVDASHLLRRVDLAKRIREFLEYASLHMANLVPWAAAGKVHFPFWPGFHK